MQCDLPGAFCRLQRQYLEEQERAGRLHAKPPTPKAPPRSLQEQHGLPPHLAGLLSDPESAMAINFSRQLWGNAAPGVGHLQSSHSMVAVIRRATAQMFGHMLAVS